MMCIKSDKMDECIRLLGESIKADSSYDVGILKKAHLLDLGYGDTWDENARKESLDLFDGAIKLHPERGSLYAMKGLVLARQSDTQDEAIELFVRAEEISPLEPRFIMAKGQALLDLGRGQEAYECLKCMPGDDPDIAGVQFTMGTNAESAGRHDAANRHYCEALKDSAGGQGRKKPRRPDQI